MSILLLLLPPLALSEQKAVLPDVAWPMTAQFFPYPDASSPLTPAHTVLAGTIAWLAYPMPGNCLPKERTLIKGTEIVSTDGKHC